MTIETTTLRDALELAYRIAEGNHASNKAHGSPALSVAYDAGRIDGLKQALEILFDVESGRL